MTPVYELINVLQVYGDRTVLDIDRLEVHRGEVLALVGPSGAGKSTLLRLLNFLETPTCGSLLYDGRPVMNGDARRDGWHVPLALRRQVTTVFQRPVLLRGSAAANVACGLRLRGRPAQPAVGEMLERVGLAEMAGLEARKLSGGEQQRVALARALVVEPQVLLLDEPTANLDPFNVGVIEALIAEVSRAGGATLVLVTHNVFQARRLATRTGLLLNGRLIELCPTEQFIERPADPRTAAFVRGEMVC
ncbi:MAG: phosphate ABC transporter ATP-binding protein [Chloroflexi bacterium]|nr:phosphate ABC transporter ATP-binding protein [Chloroflexota bacterium]